MATERCSACGFEDDPESLIEAGRLFCVSCIENGEHLEGDDRERFERLERA